MRLIVSRHHFVCRDYYFLFPEYVACLLPILVFPTILYLSSDLVPGRWASAAAGALGILAIGHLGAARLRDAREQDAAGVVSRWRQVSELQGIPFSVEGTSDELDALRQCLLRKHLPVHFSGRLRWRTMLRYVPIVGALVVAVSVAQLILLEITTPPPALRLAFAVAILAVLCVPVILACLAPQVVLVQPDRVIVTDWRLTGRGFQSATTTLAPSEVSVHCALSRHELTIRSAYENARVCIRLSQFCRPLTLTASIIRAIAQARNSISRIESDRLC